MITHEEYKKALEIVKLYREQCFEGITESDEFVNKYYAIRNTKICDSQLSIRALNILYNYSELKGNDSKIQDLSNISRGKLRKCRNLGSKTMNEIDELCKKANITMKH